MLALSPPGDETPSAAPLFEDPLTEVILGACLEVHSVLGPGLFESVYEQCLCHELELRGLHFERQRPVPIRYKRVILDCGYRADLVVEGRVLLELKTVEAVQPVHLAQVLTYIKLLSLDVGLLVNFNVPRLRQGIRRLTRKVPHTSSLSPCLPVEHPVQSDGVGT